MNIAVFIKPVTGRLRPGRRILAWLAVLCIFLALPLPATAAKLPVTEHELTLELDPDGHRLQATDRIRIVAGSGAPREQVFFLAPQADVEAVLLDRRPAAFAWDQGRLTVNLNAAQRLAPRWLTISYTARFDDPVPRRPVNTDNPGYGVGATIKKDGVLLLAGSGWYPHAVGSRVTGTVRVTAPAGMLAVTAGQLLGHQRRGRVTVSSWGIRHPVDGLSLSAGRYQVQTRTRGHLTAATYLTAANQDLAGPYLAATLDHLAFFERLLGPYPFKRFSVVENFFPTGYGFPGYTLMGGRVLRLPFIRHTSLGHEIAHCWWGNGVFVAGDSGNWSEGLTTYVADYMFKARRSPAAARAYRRQWQRNFTELVPPDSGLTLAGFVGRHDPATKALGYDKAAMVFHMLRQRVGDVLFWETLRGFFKDHRFQAAGWSDWQKAFEKAHGSSLERFFDQWISRPGAPRLALDNVRAQKGPGGYRVSGQITQTAPYFDVRLPVQATAADKTVTVQVDVHGAATPVVLDLPAPPQRLEVDPQVSVMRYLAPEEMPPTVNTLKGATGAALVVGDTPGVDGRRLAEILRRSLGLSRSSIIHPAGAARLPPATARVRVGLSGLWGRSDGPMPVRITPKAFEIQGRQFDRALASLFVVWKSGGHVDALLLPASNAAVESVAAKITHYGKYSFLVFEQTDNRFKGTWPVSASPLIHRWPR